MKITKKKLLLVVVLAVVIILAAYLIWHAAYKASLPYKYYDHINKYAQEYDVPAEVIYAVIKVESDFDVKAESSVGARGLMQMMPKTFEWLTGKEHLNENLSALMLYDAETSIKYGAYYLKYLYAKFENTETFLAAYNGGEGNVAKWLKDESYSKDGKTLSDIPFEETKKYVEKVSDEIQTYKKLYQKIQSDVKQNEQ